MKLEKAPFFIEVPLPKWLWFRKKSLNAFVLGCFVFYKKEEGITKDILNHELVHVRQFYREPFKQPFTYVTNPKARLEYEADAYSKQLLYLMSNEHKIDESIYKDPRYDSLVGDFSNVLYNFYDLSINLEMCTSILKIYLSRSYEEYVEQIDKGEVPFWLKDKHE